MMSFDPLLIQKTYNDLFGNKTKMTTYSRIIVHFGAVSAAGRIFIRVEFTEKETGKIHGAEAYFIMGEFLTLEHCRLEFIANGVWLTHNKRVNYVKCLCKTEHEDKIMNFSAGDSLDIKE